MTRPKAIGALVRTVIATVLLACLSLTPFQADAQDRAAAALAVGQLLGKFDVAPSALSNYRKSAHDHGTCRGVRDEKVRCHASYLAPASEEACRAIALAAFSGYAEAMRSLGRWLDAEVDVTCPSYQVEIAFRARDRRVQLTEWVTGSGEVVYENESRLW